MEKLKINGILQDKQKFLRVSLYHWQFNAKQLIRASAKFQHEKRVCNGLYTNEVEELSKVL